MSATSRNNQNLAAAAHLGRRTTMNVDPDRDLRWSEIGHDAAVSELLEQDSPATSPPTDAENWTDLVMWWVSQMVSADGGLSERMAWFWHGLLTTSADKVSDTTLIARQLSLFRSEGRSDYRSLLHGYVTGGALLEYLDGAGSLAARPNENLARELMELFTIGRGAYSEHDVRAGARALAGWVVEDDTVEFRRQNAFIAPLMFLGEQANWDTASIVDRLCDHPATAVRVASRLWTDLIGTAPDPQRGADLGLWWQQRDLEIDPLLERILDEPVEQVEHRNRPRSGIEWFCAAHSAVAMAGVDWPLGNLWGLEGLGQMPYLPPSVAGWPDAKRWLAPSSLLARGATVHELSAEQMAPAPIEVDDILSACGLRDVSATTREALEQASQPLSNDGPPTSETVRLIRWRLALTCPEFHLS